MTSSARRALAILEVVNSSNEALGVTAIAEAVGTLPGTAFRSLDALERCGYVARYRASTQYQVGPAAQRLKQTSYAQFKLRGIAMPFLRRLCFASGETVSLTLPVGWHALRLASVAGARPVRSSASPGIVGTLAGDYMGRAILAGQSEGFIDRFITESPHEHGRRDPDSLRAELGAITARGFAFESHDDTHPAPVAVPICCRGTPIASIAFDGPVFDRATGALPPDFTQWQAIIHELEAFVAALDIPPVNPFAHIDAAEIDRLLSLPPSKG